MSIKFVNTRSAQNLSTLPVQGFAVARLQPYHKANKVAALATGVSFCNYRIS